MQRQSLQVLQLALLLGLPILSIAQEADSSQSITAKPKQLQTVEILSTRALQKSPFTKSLILKKDLEVQNLGQDLPWLLNNSPSMVVSSDAGAGVGYTSMRIRGSDATRINITLNGVPVNDAESQGTFFVNLPDLASSSSSIQIQRGVGSATNGSGAFGATISISNTAQEDEAYAKLSMSAGSFNTHKTSLSAGTGLLNERFKLDVRLSQIGSDGYIERSQSHLQAFQTLASYKLTSKSALRFMVLSGKEKTGQAWNGLVQDSLTHNRRHNELGLKADGTYYDNQSDNYIQTYYQTFWDYQWNTNWSSTVGLFLTRGKGYYEEYRLGEKLKNYGLTPFASPNGDSLSKTDMIRQLWLDNYFYGGLYSFQYQKKKWNVQIGGSISQYSGLHYGIVKWAQYGVPADQKWYLNDAMKNDFNQYLKGQYQWNKKWTFYAEAQLRVVSYFMNGFRKNPSLRPSVVYSFFNPKIGFHYSLENSYQKQQTLYASYAIAHKEPNRNDFEASPKTLPVPEQLYDLELGYQIQRATWSLQAQAYHMQYKNQLVLNGQINDVGAYTRINVPHSYRMGVELQGHYQFKKWFQANANLSLSQNKIKQFDNYIDDYDNGGQIKQSYQNSKIAFSPQVIAGIDLGFKPFAAAAWRNLSALELHLFSKSIGRQYLDNTEDLQKSLKPYSLLDFRIQYPIAISAKSKLQLIASIYNLLNTKYESNGYNYSYWSSSMINSVNYYFPQAGRNYLLGFQLEFK